MGSAQAASIAVSTRLQASSVCLDVVWQVLGTEVRGDHQHSKLAGTGAGAASVAANQQKHTLAGQQDA
jgi:hypothetical protein